jgi:hypothetical protein
MSRGHSVKGVSTATYVSPASYHNSHTRTLRSQHELIGVYTNTRKWQRTGRQTDRQSMNTLGSIRTRENGKRQAGRQTDRQTDRQSMNSLASIRSRENGKRQAGRQTGRQADRETEHEHIGVYMNTRKWQKTGRQADRARERRRRRTRWPLF